eukprot:979736-Prorocentrum_minimum.AAC.1
MFVRLALARGGANDTARPLLPGRADAQLFPTWDEKHLLFDHYLLTAVFFALSLALALNVTQLGKMFSVVGGTA